MHHCPHTHSQPSSPLELLCPGSVGLINGFCSNHVCVLQELPPYNPILGLLVSRSLGLSVSRSLGLSVPRSLGLSVSRSVALSISRSLGLSISQSLDLSVSQSLGLSYYVKMLPLSVCGTQRGWDDQLDRAPGHDSSLPEFAGCEEGASCPQVRPEKKTLPCTETVDRFPAWLRCVVSLLEAKELCSGHVRNQSTSNTRTDKRRRIRRREACFHAIRSGCLCP